MFAIIREIKRSVIELLKVIRFRYFSKKEKWGHIGHNSIIHSPSMVSGRENIFIGDNVNIDWDNVIYAVKGKFIIQNNSGAAIGLRVITDNHSPGIGEHIKERGNANLIPGNVVVDEEVWIAANVTLLSGCHIKRGAVVGAAACVRGGVYPPYSILIGNPAKVVGFRFTPEEIVEHEKLLYDVNDRIPIEVLNSNYQKYFLSRIDEIKRYVKI